MTFYSLNMKTKKQYFGTIYSGQKATLFTVATKNITLKATNYGATITSLILKDSSNKETDIVLGFETLDSYSKNWGSFGAIIGRYSNKISNAKFTLNGTEYKLSENIQGSCLHGGIPRWENLIWNGKIIRKKNKIGLRFEKTFSDGFQGFPGNLKVTIEYLISNDNKLTFSYKAISDKETPISITNHSYFNLNGGGNVKENELQLFCEKIIQTDKDNIPTGKLIDVKNTEYDFLQPKKIGTHTDKLEYGYDTCYVTAAYNPETAIPTKDTPLVKVAQLTDSQANKKMTVFSNAEGMQLYTSGYVKFTLGKSGAIYTPFCGICFETQNFPDSPNRPEFPSTILKPNQEYNSITEFHFEF